MNSSLGVQPAGSRGIVLPGRLGSWMALFNGAGSRGTSSSSRLHVRKAPLREVEEGRSTRATPATLHSAVLMRHRCHSQSNEARIDQNERPPGESNLRARRGGNHCVGPRGRILLLRVPQVHRDQHDHVVEPIEMRGHTTNGFKSDRALGASDPGSKHCHRAKQSRSATI